MEGQIYFAYGSCMNQADLLRTVPDAIFLGGSTLKDYRLDFTLYSYTRSGGAADVIEAEGSSVEGVAWFIPQTSMTKLNAREGAPFVYKQQQVMIHIHGDESSISAITYAVSYKDAPTRPTDDYLKLMIEGAKTAGISEDYINSLATHAASLPVSVRPSWKGKSRRRKSIGSSWDRRSLYSTWGSSVSPWEQKKLDTWEDSVVEDSPSSSRVFFTHEELVSGEYGNSILDIPADEWESMTDEEIDAELERYNWWSDEDYSYRG